MNTVPSTSALEQLIRDLNDPRNQASPEAIHLTQRQIQRLQREPSAWQIGLALLNSNEALMRFYGALTLTIKVNVDWDADKVGEDRNLVASLLEQLVSSFVRLAAIPDATFVLQKLCTTLVAVFHRPDSAWALPMRHMLACTLAGHYIQQEDVPEMSVLLASNTSISGHQLRSILMLSLTLAEEAATSTSSVTHNASVRFSNNAEDIWEILRYCVVSLGQTPSQSACYQYRMAVSLDQSDKVIVAKATITLIPYWTPFVESDDHNETPGHVSILACFQACLEALHLFFDDHELSIETLQTLASLEQNHHRLLRRVLPSYAREIVESRRAHRWVEELLEGNFDPEPVLYIEFLESVMSQVDVTSSSYLKEETYTKALGQLSQLLRCKGSAGVDDTVCSTALEILSSVAEGFGDWEDKLLYENEIHALITRGSSDCLAKIRLPRSELNTATQEWDADDRAKFQDFRYDVQDFLQTAFTIIGPALIDEIVRQIISTDGSNEWALFEANLFGLVPFSDTINGAPDQFDQCLEALFESESWKQALNDPATPERVRKVVIKFIGENTGFLERHPQRLASTLDFLFGSLHITTSATSASRAIFTLCDVQRAALAAALPQFIASLNTISDLDSDSRSRVFGGVSAVVQGLPSEEAKLKPLLDILNFIEQDVHGLTAFKLSREELNIKATDTIWTLATIGKGLRAPSDSVVDLEASSTDTTHFWTEGNGHIVQQRVLAIHDTLRQQIEGEDDSLFVEATCDMLRSAFTENHPSPLKFPTAVVTTILHPLIDLSSPQPGIVLSTTSSFLASVTPTSAGREFTNLLAAVLQACQLFLTMTQEGAIAGHTEFCSAGLEFFGRMMRKWAYTWLELPDAEQSAQVMVDLGLKLLKDPDPLPRKTAAGFFTALLEASKTDSATCNEQAELKLNHIIHNHGPRIIAAVIHLIGGECARSELEPLAEPIKRFVQAKPLLANRLIKEAVKMENRVLSDKALNATKPEQRSRFASQVEMLRGARKTNDVIREFWIACRGSGFGYVV